MRTNAIQNNLAPQINIRNAPAFAKYSEGALLHAQIVDVNGTSIRLKMPDGRIAAADFRSNTLILVGDQMDLLVVGKSPRQLTLQIDALNGQSIKPLVTQLERLLLESGIEYTPKNMQNAQLLQKMALPVRPATLSAMSSLSRQADLPPAQAAFMAANAIECTAKNIALVRTWLESSPLIHQLAQPILELQAAVNEASAAANSPALPSPAQSDAQSAPAMDALATGNPKQNSPSATTMEVPLPLGAFDEQSESIRPPSGSVLSPSGSVLSPSARSNSVSSSLKEAAQIASSQTAAFLSLVGENAAESFTSISGWEQLLETALAQPKTQRAGFALSVVKSLPELTSGAVKAAILSALLSFEGSINPSETPPAEQNPNTLAKASPHGLDKLLHELFAQLVPNSEENAEQLQRAAKTVTEKMESLHTQLAAQSSEPAAQLRAGMEQLISQQKMGVELNNFYYAQLPFRFNEREQTAEIYVMKRDASKKQISEDNVTILMALSTEHLGQIESLLKFSKNTIQLQLRVESTDVERYLEKQLPLLREMMASTPFALQSITLKQADTKLTPLSVNAIVQKELGEAPNGIDISV